MFRLAEVYFDDRSAFEQASLSEEWQAMAADAQHLIDRYGVTLTAAYGDEVDRQY